MALYDDEELDNQEPGIEPELPTNIEAQAPGVDPEDDPTDEIDAADRMQEAAADLSPEDSETVDSAVQLASTPREDAPEQKPSKKVEKKIEQEIAKDSPDAEASADDDDLEAPATSHDSVLKKYQDYMEEYKKLQEQRRKGDLITGLVQAGGKIGQSIAGKYSGKFDADQSGIKLLQEMDNRPVSDFEQRQIVQGRQSALNDQVTDHDPASSKSRLLRQYLREKNIINLGDDVSYADGQALLKTIGKSATAGQGKVTPKNFYTADGKQHSGYFDPVGRKFYDSQGTLVTQEVLPLFAPTAYTDNNTKEKNLLNRTFGTSTPLTHAKNIDHGNGLGPEPELTEENLNPRQKDNLAHIRTQFQKDSKVERNDLAVAGKLKSLLTQGDPTDPKNMIEIERNINLLSGASGRIPLDQLKASGGIQSWQARIAQAAQQAKTGGLTPENNKFLLDTTDRMIDSSQDAIRKYAEPHLNSLHTGVPKASKTQLSKLLGVEPTAVPTPDTATQVDPQIAKFAREHSLTYDAANTIIQTRKKKRSQVAGE